MLKFKIKALAILILANTETISAAEIVSGSSINRERLGEKYNFYVKGIDNCAFKGTIIENKSTINKKSEFSISVEEKTCSGVVTKINKISEIQNSSKEVPAGVTFAVSDF